MIEIERAFGKDVWRKRRGRKVRESARERMGGTSVRVSERDRDRDRDGGMEREIEIEGEVIGELTFPCFL